MNSNSYDSSKRGDADAPDSSNNRGRRPPPHNTSDPSVAFTLLPKKQASSIAASQQQHNRTVTPHTASLMSLFARPASTPLTPLTPHDPDSEEANNNLYGSLLGDKSALSLPKEDEEDESDQSSCVQSNTSSSSDDYYCNNEGYTSPDYRTNNNIIDQDENEDSITPKNNNYNYTAAIDAAVVAAENAPLLPSPPPSAAALKNENGGKNYYSTISSSHKRDVTHITNNLSNMQQQEQQWLWGGALSLQLQRWGNQSSTIPNHNGEHEYEFERLPPSSNKKKQHPRPSASFLQSTLIKAGLSTSHQIKSTLVGAFLFSLYQLVFIFAEASAITRPSHPSSASSILLSPMANMTCFGSLIVIPILIVVLGGDYPALYPCLDMFMAPFLAKMAIDIDEVLVVVQQQQVEGEEVDDTDVFLATFVALNAFGMVVCGVLCVLASHVKLANLALFLPYPVLCGFFSSVGLSIWMSSFKVDTGITVQNLWGAEHRLFLILKHVPSIVSGIVLYFLAPKSPLYLIGIIACTIALAYSTMALTGISLEYAQSLGFFWEEKEVVMTAQAHFDSPMHLWSDNISGKICWNAFMNGVPDVIAMGLIYLIRCSLQAAALKRNRANILRSREAKAAAALEDQSLLIGAKDTKEDEIPKRKPKDVLEVLMQFANTLFITAMTGGFAVLPSVGLSNTFVKIGAESRAPQFVSCLLVLGCYVSEFRIISFVPKCTFSSLLVMASIDLLTNWFMKSYHKTGSEWFVVPFIVLAGQLFGVLQSVALGVGISTLMFVSSFYKAGTVKFLANGLTLRSTIERQAVDNIWLDTNGDLIQILVLQNYLFFGNASSVLNYIASMFDDLEESNGSLLPPKPKYLVLDMSIVSGVDISAVDCFADVTSLCKTQDCKLIISGSSKVVRQALLLGGVKPKSHPHLSFVEDLDAALGISEDGLLKVVGHNVQRIEKNHVRGAHLRGMSEIDIGLRLALKQIDEQHNLAFANQLQGLAEYTTALDLQAGEQLDLPRGLYFVESGMIKCEADASASLTRGRQKLFATPVMGRSTDSIGQLSARSSTVGRGQAALKSAPGMMSQFSHTFRLARFGPGFVIGCISEFTGQEIPGTFVCMTESRVHYLPFGTIEELETTKPVLIMHLYKLLAHLAARRQEMTIGQLSTLRSIMSSSVPSKPISRKAMARLSINFKP